MNNGFSVFNSQEFKSIRGVLIGEEVWFVAKDVAEALGYTDTTQAIRKLCRYARLVKASDFGVENDSKQLQSDMEANSLESRKGVSETPLNNSEEVQSNVEANSLESRKGVSETPLNNSEELQDTVALPDSNFGFKIIPEPDFYALVFRSTMPKAKEFQDWVFSEVLPTLRKTGYVSINDVNMAVVKELGESTRQLAFVTNRLTDTSRELGIMQYKYGLATAKLHVLTNLPAPKDVLVDPKRYLSASKVFMDVAGYYMRKDNDKGDSIIKLGKLLYNTSIAKGYPLMVSRREFVFHKDVVDECIAALKAKAGPRDIDLAFMPGARKKAGVSGLNMSSILMDMSDEEVEEAVDNPSDDDDLTFDI